MKKLFLLLVILATLISCSKKEGASNDEKSKVGDGKLIIWGFFEGMPKQALDEWSKATGKIVEYQTIGWADYQTKLNTVLGTADAPDIVLLERSFMGQFLPTDNFLPIGELWKDKPEMQNYLNNTDKGVLGQGAPNGVVKAVGWENTSGAFYYRKDMAEKYLGVKTPEEMEALISTPDSFIKLMTEFESKAKGTKFLTRNALSLVEMATSGAYNFEADGSYKISKKMQEGFKNIKKYYAMNNFYTPAYDKTAVLNGTKKDKFFGALEPAWSVQDIKEWNQPGLWQIANPPFKWVTGGTFMAVTTNADQDLAWDFLSKTFLNEEWLLKNMEGFGMIANSKLMNNYITKSGAGKNDYFGGQNTIKKFSEISASITQVIPATMYDSGLGTAIEDVINGLTVDGTIKNEVEAATKLKEALSLLYPDLKVIIE